nr:DUF1616 domain-containing protein [Halomarina salina]
MVYGLFTSNLLGSPGSTLRILVTLPLLVFAPGYALGAAAFPHAPSGERRGSLLDRVRERPTGIDTTERVALGFGLSLTLLPIVGVLVAFETGPFTADTSIVALSGVAALFTIVAAIRRWRLSAEERYGLPFGVWADSMGRSQEGSGTDVLLSVGLGVSVVLALAAGGFAIASPLDGEQFSTLGAGHINDEGEFVLGPSEELTENITAGETVDSAFLVKNDEERATEYTVVVQIHRVDDQGNTFQSSEINRYRQTIEQGATWINPHQVTPRIQGTNVRIVYLLYAGPVPAGASTANADEYAFHAINVTAGDE